MPRLLLEKQIHPVRALALVRVPHHHDPVVHRHHHININKCCVFAADSSWCCWVLFGNISPERIRWSQSRGYFLGLRTATFQIVLLRASSSTLAWSLFLLLCFSAMPSSVPSRVPTAATVVNLQSWSWRPPVSGREVGPATHWILWAVTPQTVCCLSNDRSGALRGDAVRFFCCFYVCAFSTSTTTTFSTYYFDTSPLWLRSSFSDFCFPQNHVSKTLSKLQLTSSLGFSRALSFVVQVLVRHQTAFPSATRLWSALVSFWCMYGRVWRY